MPNHENAALIVAAGKGERAQNGAIPKQYRPLAGKPVLRWSLEAFAQNPAISAIQVVIRDEDRAIFEKSVQGLELLPPVVGGATRQASVANGLKALAQHRPAHVLIHDGARPFVSQRLIQSVLAELEIADAAVPFLPVNDAIWRKEKTGFETVSRDDLRCAQTPQGFDFESILNAHRNNSDAAVVDDMAIAKLAGMKIAEVAGEEANIKLTHAGDFDIAACFAGSALWEVRTGTGFDVHKFSPGDHVWLCGVRVPHAMGLEGHSDADAGLHALTDAILGSVSAGDIGLHFPPTDPQWRNAPSHVFLEKAASLVRELGGVVAHVDVTLICEQPKITPHREAMRMKIAEILGIAFERVSVKATTTEGLGAIGRGEGIAAQAVATIRLPGGAV
jgi:2-C-methyl-D-erythritol 4-phosphate cytidylyltransferase/2-C-methyl-D-erythritol 2,4-cyclodiphosphate synthase